MYKELGFTKIALSMSTVAGAQLDLLGKYLTNPTSKVTHQARRMHKLIVDAAKKPLLPGESFIKTYKDIERAVDNNIDWRQYVRRIRTPEVINALKMID